MLSLDSPRFYFSILFCFVLFYVFSVLFFFCLLFSPDTVRTFSDIPAPCRRWRPDPTAPTAVAVATRCRCRRSSWRRTGPGRVPSPKPFLPRRPGAEGPGCPLAGTGTFRRPPETGMRGSCGGITSTCRLMNMEMISMITVAAAVVKWRRFLRCFEFQSFFAVFLFIH